MISEYRSNSEKLIVLQNNDEYRLYLASAPMMPRHVSVNDRPTLNPAGTPLVDLRHFLLNVIFPRFSENNDVTPSSCESIENEDSPMIFHYREHHDKRLEISKAFEFYFEETTFGESRNYFIKSFSKLNINTDDAKYQFKL